MAEINMAELDITQALKDTENTLRDFLTATLQKACGERWTQKCGVSNERVQKWEQRKADESKRQPGGAVEPRILYYADFYDLQTILKKHWDKCSPALGEWRTMEVFLGELEKLRDPDAHRRELLPHQKLLAMGIAGEIRTRLIRYRSKQETAEDYFPRIEAVRDSLGNICLSEKSRGKVLVPDHILRPDDIIDFVVTASDPLGEALDYGISVGYTAIIWQRHNTFSVRITDAHVSTSFLIKIQIKSTRNYHASDDHDDEVEFYYTVLPRKNPIKSAHRADETTQK